MSIECTNREAGVLRESLESTLSELSTEIAHTDSKDSRDELNLRRDLLRGVADRFDIPAS